MTGLLDSKFDSAIQIAGNLIPGAELKFSFGAVENATANKVLDLWWPAFDDVTHAAIPFPTTASKINLESNSAADSAAGIGARKVRVRGVDSSFNELSEIVDMDGINPVQTVKSYLRAKFDVFKVGEYESGIDKNGNKGVITATRDSDSILVGTIGLDSQGVPNTVDYNSLISVPRGKRASIVLLIPNVDSVKTIDFILNTRSADPAVVSASDKPVQDRPAKLKKISGLKELDFSSAPYAIPEMTDFWFTIETDAGGGDAEITVAYYLLDNEG